MLGGDGQHSSGNFQHNVKRSQTTGTGFMGQETGGTGPSVSSSFTGPGFPESQQTRLNSAISGAPGSQTSPGSLTGPVFSGSLASGQIGPVFDGPQPFGKSKSKGMCK